jgi:hypothetical protein
VRDRTIPGGAGSAAASATSAPEPGKQSLTEKLGRPAPPPAQVGKRALTDAYAGGGGDLGGRGAAGDPADGSGSSGAHASLGGPPPAVQEALASETGAPLSDAARWSKRLRADLSGARIVTGPRAEAAAAAIGTAAFTVGNRVFLGAGVTPSDETVLAHELTHVVQQMGATVPSPDQLKMTSPDDPVEREARGEGGDHPPGTHGAAPGAHAAGGEAAIAAFPFPMGPGGGGAGSLFPGPKNPQLDAFKYFEQHGRAHLKELMERGLGDPTIDTGSPYASWTAGTASVFTEKLASDLFSTPGRPWDTVEKTLVPTDIWKLIDGARDAENKDDPAQANEYHLNVTLALEHAYRDKLREALKRLTPRLIKEWNRRTLADNAERSKNSKTPLPEHPETNQPGVGILQSHPIDRFVLGALWGLTTPTLKPDFAAFRKDFPEEGKPHGPRDGKPVIDTLRKVSFQWQSPNQARHWIKVTDPIDATPEEVAHELFGNTLRTYLITPAPPLFGFDIHKDQLRSPYEQQYAKFYDDKSPGGDPAHEILAGKQGDDAALDQAAGRSTAKPTKPVVLQQFDLLIDELKKIVAGAHAWVTLEKEIDEVVARAEKRKKAIADSTDTKESDKWNAQVREQLDIAGKVRGGIDVIGKLFHSFSVGEPRDLAYQIGAQFVQAAGHSDLVVTARAELERANQRLLAFPADWIEAQFRWIHRAILASQTNAKTGKDDQFVKSLGEKEKKLRLDLEKVRDKLLTSPLTVEADLDRITKELSELATAASAARNIDLCNEAFVQVKDAKSATGWIRSLASNPLTGNHGNDRLDALAGRAESFQSEWNAILKKWNDGDQQGASHDLQAKATSPAWKQFFEDVAKEIKDQARYDAWMTFAILVGITILTGFAGALLEPIAVAALGPLLGFAVTVTAEATLFTALSYALVEKHPNMAGFKNELGKNVLVFGALKGLSKAFAGLEKVLAVELKEAEVIAQFAAINGLALYQANQEKAKHGQTLSESEIMKISFDNLIFIIAVAIGGKALAPMLTRWKVKLDVGRGLKEIEALHQQVESLAAQAKAAKDKTIGEQLLQKQRELLTAEREFLEALLQLAAKGRDAALKKGMTAEQYDALMNAKQDLEAATRGLREAELMGKLEPVMKGQYLCEPGKTLDDAHDHYTGDAANKVGKIVTDATNNTRSFEIQLPDGSTLRISERAGKIGDVKTGTTATTTSGGEPAPPRAEEVAKAHGINDPAALKSFEALYLKDPKAMLAFLEALKGQPGLASRLLAKFGEAALTHFQPIDGTSISIHGEIDIAAAKLGSFTDGDVAKLVEVAKNKGPVADYEYFESTGTGGGKPGSRLRFKLRILDRVSKMSAEIKATLKLSATDPRGEIFDPGKMSEGDATRMWDLFNEQAYTDSGMRQQAAEWALTKNPKSASEFVAECQFYEAEAGNRADGYVADAKAEVAKEVAARKAANGGRDLNPREQMQATRTATRAKLGRAFDADGPALKRYATQKALQDMGQKVTKDGKEVTVGADAADAAWKTNVDALHGADAAGPKTIGGKPDAELPAHLQSIADSLSFGTDYDAAYHAHKHAGELPVKPPAANEMATYLKAARDLVRSGSGTVRINQNGSRSVIFEGNGMRAIVHVSSEGNAVIATFGAAN